MRITKNSRFSAAWLLFSGAMLLPAQASTPNSLSAAQAQALIQSALANELNAAQDTARPMRYVLRKTTPRLSAMREIYETAGGDVARLLAVDGRPLGAEAERKEESRLAVLAADPARQRRREQAEEADRERAFKLLRALPTAFLYEYSGTEQLPSGSAARFFFQPNPGFSPPNLETQVLTAMAGEIWIDPAARRVVRLDGRLEYGVNFGWGILGRLNKGGWIRLDQAEVLPGQWRTVRVQLAMSGRVLFKNHNFDMTQEESHFAPLPPEMSYEQAIAELEAMTPDLAHHP